MDSVDNIQDRYKHFRILVIGRANAGKTTLLKRVCNTTEEPCVYDEENQNLVYEQLEPTADRGIHDVHRPFAFASNPQFIFHDSPGFEQGGERELKDVQQFIEQCGKATEVDDQLHAIWFCMVTDASRPLLELEERFFNEKRYGNVPVIAIFTKFDDFVIQTTSRKMKKEKKYEMAKDVLNQKFEEPLNSFQFPPKAMLYLKGMPDDGDHQKQVKELIEKTANSLHDPALKLLFVSIQQNNLELCMKYAIK
ncbi:hypothetical protein K435DRAFT_657587 [Dendrothele bispora CBS 962.96]|uniref:G domain-containing protein n=1 Tax=Dendrothele bispora (strain CBS 962.96) TaxID=1314807 RepID=A0A4V4HGU9_DENBC|nr:hypothetical protein K435DRAFT_657587 [Dendrothele bispora CBS 962.96]